VSGVLPVGVDNVVIAVMGVQAARVVVVVLVPVPGSCRSSPAFGEGPAGGGPVVVMVHMVLHGSSSGGNAAGACHGAEW
jgi:hypothetical protein